MKQFVETDVAQELARSMESQLSFDTFLKKRASSNDLTVAVDKLNEAIIMLNDLGQHDEADRLVTILESIGNNV